MPGRGRRRYRDAVKRLLLLVIGLLAVVTAVGAVWLGLKQPSNDRDWNPDQAVLPKAEFAGSQVTIAGFRNFNYRSTDDFDVRYETRVFDLDELERAWFIVEPFSDFEGAAHTFLSFTFSDGRALAVSVEIRKEVGEEFGVLAGLLRNYELMYVIGDERDLIGLRAIHRRDEVFVYPASAEPEVARQLLVDMLGQANALHERPVFYNTLTRNCTTAIMDHVNGVQPGTVPWGRRVLFPGYSDELALELGLLATDLGPDEIRDAFRVNDAVDAFIGHPDFSRRIRDPLPVD